MDNFDYKKYLKEGRINLNEVEDKKDEEDKVRDGVKSAAEKLGMKPSHINEVGNFDFTIYGSEYDFETSQEMGSDPMEIYYEATLDKGSEEEMIALAKEYAANSPKEKFIVTHSDDPWNEVWSTDAESMDKKERRAGINEDINYDVFDEKPDMIAQTLDVESMASSLEFALSNMGLEELDDINSREEFTKLVDSMKKDGDGMTDWYEVPSEFFALKPIQQVRILSQAQMYI